MHFYRPASLLLFALSLPLLAQTHFCIAGDLDHLTQTEITACHTKMTQVRDEIKRRGAPSGWHFVVVCDESGWSDYASFSGKTDARLKDADFETNRDEHFTFLRGSRIAEDSARAAGVMLKAALLGVPGRQMGSDGGAGPQPMPNPKRTVQVPSLLMAETQVRDESVAGQ
ncbi:MAG: hypothetical protein ACRYF4_08615 [Janthinobacterium lividum]